ncbi:MAG: hypothetical protein WBV28_07705 [Terracidiphilus sp.]
MSLVDSLRNGLKFFLMSLGVSTPEKKPLPPAPTVPKNHPNKGS